jgi:hypothetical protein
MNDKNSNISLKSQHLLKASEAALSPRAFSNWCDELFKFAPNPFKVGRENQIKAWRRSVEKQAKTLVWC